MKPQPTKKQSEHLGDAVLHVAARDLVFNLFKRNQKYYFKWILNIISNDNFSTYYYYNPNKKKKLLNAKQFEIDIGKIYFNNGIGFALKVAKFRIKQTQRWFDLMEFYNGDYIRKHKDLYIENYE